jgi:hypothetical protein
MRVILRAERLGGNVLCVATVKNDFQADVELYREYPEGVYTNQRWSYYDE